jgi:mannose-6-phosphate isomerase-like protein (cupin superfamily)
MKIVRQNETHEVKNSDNCIVIEYPTLDSEMDFAIAHITGRYPEKNRAVNIQCKEMVYIQQGQGIVEVEGKHYSLKTGDCVLIEAGEKFFWEGQMTLFISCRPAFHIEQHQWVE